VGQLDLLSLLRTGIPVEVPDGRRLFIGVLRADSPLRDGPSMGDGSVLGEQARIFAIIRGEHMMVPGPRVTLQAGDRLLLLTTPEALQQLAQHLDRW
jgi:Trk K+ transport system NAD-binding subunit